MNSPKDVVRLSRDVKPVGVLNIAPKISEPELVQKSILYGAYIIPQIHHHRLVRYFINL